MIYEYASLAGRLLAVVLLLRSHTLVQASQAGEHMSRRAASIEPEDGECTPSPSAVQQAQNAARHHAVAHPPPVMQALPPPPPAATIRPDVRYQVKVLCYLHSAIIYQFFHMPLSHLASSFAFIAAASLSATHLLLFATWARVWLFIHVHVDCFTGCSCA